MAETAGVKRGEGGEFKTLGHFTMCAVYNTPVHACSSYTALHFNNQTLCSPVAFTINSLPTKL